MFGSKQAAPVERPFQHTDRCKYKDNEPEWNRDDLMGVERRQCVCTSESRQLVTGGGRLDPRTQSPEPAAVAALHTGGASCPGYASEFAVHTVPDPIDGGWKSTCMVCTSITHFWWDPNRWEPDAFGDMVRVTRAGNLLYVYEPKTPQGS